jgi:hypothetical protein
MGRMCIVLDTAFIHEMIPIPSSCAKTRNGLGVKRGPRLLIDIDGWLLPPGAKPYALATSRLLIAVYLELM